MFMHVNRQLEFLLAKQLVMKENHNKKCHGQDKQTARANFIDGAALIRMKDSTKCINTSRDWLFNDLISFTFYVHFFVFVSLRMSRLDFSQFIQKFHSRNISILTFCKLNKCCGIKNRLSFPIFCSVLIEKM